MELWSNWLLFKAMLLESFVKLGVATVGAEIVVALTTHSVGWTVVEEFGMDEGKGVPRENDGITDVVEEADGTIVEDSILDVEDGTIVVDNILDVADSSGTVEPELSVRRGLDVKTGVEETKTWGILLGIRTEAFKLLTELFEYERKLFDGFTITDDEGVVW